ncbi:hypothetical protein SAMN02745124_03539 [Desulfofustis glycolicus DSM 9705]|uniref:Uncharacterized protein n=1 Tax=Desulfofustis glycolicus DSM 9705 TaxID=1121409 RepID=A0A1M5Y0X3_9BACT|nr:hypothetical protein SAMN02745124_03539 [Desulfofustis glycolicus DSM 9705]
MILLPLQRKTARASFHYTRRVSIWYNARMSNRFEAECYGDT